MGINLIKVGMRIKFRKLRGTWIEGRVTYIWPEGHISVLVDGHQFSTLLNLPRDYYDIEEVVCLKRNGNKKD